MPVLLHKNVPLHWLSLVGKDTCDDKTSACCLAGDPIWLGCTMQVQLMCRYLNPKGGFEGIMEVPDPYYGGAKGFELVRCDVRSSSPTSLQPAGYSASVASTLNRALTPSHQPAADLNLAGWRVRLQVLDLLEDACTGLLQHIQEHDLQNRAKQAA